MKYFNSQIEQFVNLTNEKVLIQRHGSRYHASAVIFIGYGEISNIIGVVLGKLSEVKKQLESNNISYQVEFD